MNATIRSSRWRVSRFGLFVPMVFLVFVGAILAARWVGSLRPLPPLESALFKERDGTGKLCQNPCGFGVRPEQLDAVTGLDSQAVLYNLDSYMVGRSKVYRTRFIQIQVSDQWITVTLVPNSNYGPTRNSYNAPEALDGNVYLGDFIALFGMPDGVQFIDKGGIEPQLTFQFTRNPYFIAATVFSNRSMIDPRTELTHLTITTISNARIGSIGLGGWKGFISRRRYEGDTRHYLP
jgi:hypothetical protein